ncbi:MAG: hypothetical protein GY737_09355 [Desulfobacteraceae bacterium]|nr:hypothetical protein [Desulfobacteraceae bacterium]
MKKTFLTGLIFLIVLCFQNSAFAGPYTGTVFPSDKHFEAFDYSSESSFLKTIGKHKNQDNSYTVYFLMINGRKTVTSTMRVLQLDTNYWVAVGDDLKRSPSIVQNLR